MNPLELANAFLLRPAQTMAPNFTPDSNYSEYKHAATSVEEVTETATPGIVLPSPPRQINNQLAALPLLVSGTSNASAKQIVKHIRRRTQNQEKEEKSEWMMMLMIMAVERNARESQLYSTASFTLLGGLGLRSRLQMMRKISFRLLVSRGRGRFCNL